MIENAGRTGPMRTGYPRAFGARLVGMVCMVDFVDSRGWGEGFPGVAASRPPP